MSPRFEPPPSSLSPRLLEAAQQLDRLASRCSEHTLGERHELVGAIDPLRLSTPSGSSDFSRAAYFSLPPTAASKHEDVAVRRTERALRA